MKIIAVWLLWMVEVSLRIAWLISRACSPMWLSPISPSISARGTRAATESTTIDIDRVAAHQHLGDIQGLLAGVRLGDQQVIEVHSQLLGIAGIQGMLGIDEGGRAAQLLGIGDHVQGQGGLARALRAEDLDHPAAGDAADPDGQVEVERPGADRIHRSPGLRSRPGA